MSGRNRRLRARAPCVTVLKREARALALVLRRIESRITVSDDLRMYDEEDNYYGDDADYTDDDGHATWCDDDGCFGECLDNEDYDDA